MHSNCNHMWEYHLSAETQRYRICTKCGLFHGNYEMDKQRQLIENDLYYIENMNDLSLLDYEVAALKRMSEYYERLLILHEEYEED